MRQCDYCGNDMSNWNIDEGQMLMCDLCVQRLLGYATIERPQLMLKRRTRGREGIGMGKPWNHKKCPLKWSDQ